MSIRRISLAICGLWVAGMAMGQASETPLPFDPGVLTGRLQNGLSYYVKRYPTPAGRATMQFVVDVGTADEEPDQVEYAHMLEHVVVAAVSNRDTQGDVFTQAERIGAVTRGTDINAFTGPVSTGYFIQFSPDIPGAMEKALGLARDWAGARVDDEVAARESRAVIEEIRRSGAASGRLNDRYHAAKGFTEASSVEARLRSMRDASPTRVRAFHAKWYTPDHFALIVVGDLDAEATVRSIRERFDSLPASPSPVHTRRAALSLRGTRQAFVLTDAAATEINLQLVFLRPHVPLVSERDMQESIAAEILSAAFQDRLAGLRDHYGAALDSGGGINGREIRNRSQDALLANFYLRPNRLKQGVQDAFGALDSARRLGFSESELQAAKARVLKDEATHVVDSQTVASWLQAHFLEHSAVLEPQRYTTMRDSLTRNLTLADLNRLTAQWIGVPDQDIVFNGVEPPGTTDELLSWVDDIERAPARPAKLPRPLDALKPVFTPTPEGVLSPRISPLANVGATRLDYPANGVTVIVRPQASKDERSNEVTVYAFSPGGARTVAGKAAGEVALESGIAGLNRFELARLLEARGVSLAPHVGATTESMRGSAPKEQAELLLQLLREYFVRPQFDPAGFEDWKYRIVQAIGKVERSEDYQRFDGLVSQAIYRPGLSPRWSDAQSVQHLKLNDVRRVYRQRFGNASDFVFVIGGAVDVADITPLISRTLGTLPANGPSEKNLPATLALRDGPFRQVWQEGAGIKASVRYDYSGGMKWDARTVRQFDLLSRILRARLHERLRERERGTYAVTVGGGLGAWPEEYRLGIEFDCAPENIGRLSAAVDDEIRLLRRDGPRAAELRDAIFALTQSEENAPDVRSEWLAHQFFALAGNTALLQMPAPIAASPAEIQQVARDVLSPRRLKQFVRRPLSTGASPAGPPIALVGGTIFDGNGGEAVREGTILIQGERIVAVGPSQAIPTPPGARQIDVRGRFLTPGLIDTNVHLTSSIFGPVDEQREVAQVSRYLRQLLEQGITTVRDTYGLLAPLRIVREQQNRGEVPGARLLAAGNIIGYGGLDSFTGRGWEAIRSPELRARGAPPEWLVQGVGENLLTLDATALRLEIDRYLDKGPDFIKIGVTSHSNDPPVVLLFSQRALDTMVQAAHARGKRVDVHATTLEGLRMAALAGVDVIQHPERLATGTRITPEVAQLLVDEDVVCALMPISPVGPVRPVRRDSPEFYNAVELIRSGCRITVASDDVFDWPDKVWGHNTHRAIEGLVDYGLTPMEALTAATRNGAIAAGAIEDYGTLEVGKRADVLILEKDPRQDVRHLRTVRGVIQNGKIVR